ncbi:SORBS1 family protein [Megaselia abdita]
MFIPKFKAKPPPGATGIWSPRSTSVPNLTDEEPKFINQPSVIPLPPPPPPQPIYSNGSVKENGCRSLPATPQAQRKEFRPVKFSSPVLPRKYTAGNSFENGDQPPWSSPTSTASIGATSTRSNTAELRRTTDIVDHSGKSTSCSNVNQIKNFEKSSSFTDKSRHPHPPHRVAVSKQPPPFVKPNEVIYTLKHEYMSEPETENDSPRKMAKLGQRGSTRVNGTSTMPINLRSEVNHPNQHEWYKKIFQTLHKPKNDDCVTVRYKCPRGRYPYKSSGYQSEPEGYHYDSDYYTMNNKPLDRRRTVWPPAKETESNQRPYIPNIIKSGSPPYRVHPGKIEDYTPGFSSLVVDKKEEVKKGTLSHLYTEGNLARSLLEQGYESDSNLIFHKKQIEENDLDKYLNDYEKRQSYKRMQIGGEPPLLGFRKPAPEKPKVSPSRYIETDVNIHYKSPVRFECKELIAEDELAHLQAERMKKVYEQEKYDKYIRQLQDINSRRHRDHFMSSQKSPIPLNRYDDFNSEYICIKSPNLIPPNTISKALYDFKGQSLRELSFKKGDYIILRRQIDNNWFEGEHNARVGLLPIKYVEVMTKELGRRPKTPSEGQARAKYSFNAQSAVELSLNKGELVTLTRRVDGNWFEGKIANRKGIFPVNYVEVLTDIGAEDKLTKSIAEYSATVSATARNNYNNNIIPIDSIKETKTVSHSKVLHVDTEHEPVLYRALYKYRPQNNDELELKEGDLVFVLEVCDDGWYVGTSQRTGCFGTFPGNYVQMVRD